MKKINIFTISAFIILVLGCNQGDVKKENHSPDHLTDAKIQLYKNKIVDDPSNYNLYNILAQNYIQKARETGITAYYNEAEILLKRSLEIKADNFLGLLLYAKINLANHRFHSALNYAEHAVVLMPGRSEAYGILGDAYLELGRINNAGEAYKKMLALKPGLDSYSRMSNLMHRLQNHEKALMYMEHAYESGIKNSSTPAESLAWTQFMMGRIYLQMGKYDMAERCFNRSIEIYDEYYLAVEQLDWLRHKNTDKSLDKHYHGLTGVPHTH